MPVDIRRPVPVPTAPRDAGEVVCLHCVPWSAQSKLGETPGVGSTSAFLMALWTGDERVVQDGMLVGDARRFICVLEQPRTKVTPCGSESGSGAVKQSKHSVCPSLLML